MNINIDLGNFWDILSSFGTVFSAVTALYLGFRTPKYKKIKIEDNLTAARNGNLIFFIQNNEDRVIKVIEAGIYIYKIKGKKYQKRKHWKITNNSTTHIERTIGTLYPGTFKAIEEETKEKRKIREREKEIIRNYNIVHPFETVTYATNIPLRTVGKKVEKIQCDYQIYLKLDNNQLIMSNKNKYTFEKKIIKELEENNNTNIDSSIFVNYNH